MRFRAHYVVEYRYQPKVARPGHFAVHTFRNGERISLQVLDHPQHATLPKWRPWRRIEYVNVPEGCEVL